MSSIKLKTIEVLGKPVEIEYKDIGDNWGECHHCHEKIVLHPDLLDDPYNHAKTLYHEVGHYIYEETGVSYTKKIEEETHVRIAENLMLHWIIKNLKLLEPVVEHVHQGKLTLQY